MAELAKSKNSTSSLTVPHRRSQLFPKTHQNIRERNYVKRLNKFWNEHNTKMILETKLRNLEDIKIQMLHNKMIYECHIEEKQKTNICKDTRLFNDLKKHYNLTENVVPPHSFINRFKQYKKSQNELEVQQIENKIAIVKKLLLEYRREQEINFQQLNINEQLLLLGKDKYGKKEIEKPEQIESINTESSKINLNEDEDEEIALKISNKLSMEIAPTTNINQTNLISKHEDITQPSTGPHNMKNVSQNIPPVPVLNLREKIPIPDEIVHIDELLESWMKCDFLDEKRELHAQEFLDHIEEDDNFIIHPKLILFDNFTCGNIYKKSAVITNKNKKIIKCKFIRVQHNYDLDPMILQVQPNSTQVLWCGMSIQIRIIFNPIDAHNAIEGEIVFHTLRVDYAKQKQIKLKILCLPLKPEVCIDPEVVIFKTLPFWNSYNKVRTKNINIKNNGTEEYFISIRHRMKETENLSEEGIESYESLHDNNDALEEEELATNIAESIISICMYQAFAVFRIDTYFFKIPPKSSVPIKTLLSNTYGEGQFIENFDVSMYENEECTKLVTSKDFTAKCECTGIFYFLNEYILDFQICVVDSGVYQNAFSIYNNYKNLLLFKCKCPDSIKDYILIYPAETYVSSHKTQIFTIRFTPRYEMLQGLTKYYDSNMGILDFPIKIFAVGSEYSDVPPLNLYIYAILTSPYDVKISWPDFDPNFSLEQKDDFTFPESAEEIRNLQIIEGEVQSENHSHSLASFTTDDSINHVLNTFLSDPPKPKLTCDLQLVTTRESVYVKFNLVNKTMVIQEFGFFNLPKCVSILPGMGFGTIYPGEVLDLILIYSPEITDIKNNTKYICGTTGVHTFDVNCTTVILSSQYKPNEMKFMSRPQTELSISFTSTIQDPLCLLEYQNLEFPSTPCGSYTLMTMELKASPMYPCYCGVTNKIEPQHFSCEFEFKNTNPQLFIEPRHGTIKTNGKVKIVLLSQPVLDYKIVHEKAVLIKEAKLKQIKLNEIIAKAEKNKKPLKEIPEIIINPNDIILDSSDLYMAEKEIWRSLDPYVIKAHISCLLHYENNDRKEVLFFDIQCPVVNPDFLLDIEKELIDFGPTVIGGYKKHIIRLQNITRNYIRPTISLVNPIGPLKCFCPLNVVLEPEHFLLIPLIYEPIDEKLLSEYIQFQSNNTIVHVNVRGYGIELNMEYAPDFPIRRIETNYQSAIDISLDFKNKSDSEIRYTIKLINELEGHIVEEIPYPPNVVPPKPGKPPGKNSQDFSPQEEFSLRNNFSEKHGASFFNIKQGVINDNEIIVPPLMKTSLKITFEEPRSSITTTPSTKGKIVNPHLGKHYVARYKLYLNRKKYVRDLIIIGSFI